MAVAQDDIDTFRDRVVGRRVNEETADKYEKWIRRFERWNPHQAYDVGALIDFDSVLADEDWTDYPWETVRGPDAPDAYAYRSRVIALSAAKLWCRLHYGENILEDVQNIASGEPEPFDPPYLSVDDVEDTIENAPGACGAPGCAAAMRVSYDAILRAAEMCSIQREDIDLDAGTLYVRSVKGGLNATVSLEPDTVTALREYLAEHGGRGHVFENSYGNRWRPNAWAKHFLQYHHEAGSHSFGRHSPIVHRLQDGESFGEVYQRARHTNPNMTSRYARLIGIDVPDWAGE